MKKGLVFIIICCLLVGCTSANLKPELAERNQDEFTIAHYQGNSVSLDSVKKPLSVRHCLPY